MGEGGEGDGSIKRKTTEGRIKINTGLKLLRTWGCWGQAAVMGENKGEEGGKGELIRGGKKYPNKKGVHCHVTGEKGKRPLNTQLRKNEDL